MCCILNFQSGHGEIVLSPSLAAYALKCGTPLIHAISYVHYYQNTRFRLLEMNVCTLTSSELTNALTVDEPVVFSILRNPPWLRPECGADCGHWCSLQSQFQSTHAAQVLAVG